MTKAQEAGRQFEKAFAKLIGGELVPGSGSQWWAKMDVGDRTILWGLKSTGKQSFSLTKKLLKEVIDAATGIGGRSMLPGWAFEINGQWFVVLRATDFARIVQEDIKITPPSREDEKRARAKIPLILRRDDD